jgi:hypothetical protein
MSGETAPSRGRKVGMTPDQHVPLMPWAAHMIQCTVQKDAIPQGGANPKNRPQYGLRSATDLMKPESLVIVGQLYHGEYVLESCTHRPSTQGSWGCPISCFAQDYGKLGDRE